MTTQAPVKISADLYDVQEQFLFDEHAYAAMVAGRGAGKTYVGCLKDLHYALAYPGAFLVVAAPSFPMLRETTRRTFLQLCPREIIARFNQQENLLELAGGSQVLFRSLDNPDSVRGLNAAAVHVDEAAFCSSEAWRIIKATVRQPSFPRQAWITSTPKGRNWIWEEWEAQPTPEHVLYRARSSFNPALPSDFEASLGYSGAFYEQEVLGEFVGFEGLVYPGFTRRHVQPVRDAARHRVVAGVDFGFRDPATLIVVVDHRDHRYHIAEEWYARSVTIEEQIKAALDLKARYGIERFLADPSRPDSIELMKRAGLPVYPADNDILTGISTVTTLLAERGDGGYGLLIAPSCVQTIAEFEAYQWPDAKPNRNAGEKPLDMANHCLAAGTLVQTDRGALPIEQIPPGRRVLTRLGYRPVVAGGLTRLRAPTYTLRCSDGRTLVGTGDHPVWTRNHGWVRLADLRYGDILEVAPQGESRRPCDGKQSSIKGVPLRAILMRRAARIASTLPTLPADSFIASSGKTASGRYPRVIISTTRMAIPPTTTPPTSSVWRRATTDGARGSSARPSASSARTAVALLSIRPGARRRAFVRLRVRQRGDAPPAPMTRNGRARIVGAPSGLTATTGYVTARDCALSVLDVRPTGRREPVYDLTVADAHEFYAGGILVHNCMDALRYACQWLEYRPAPARITWG